MFRVTAIVLGIALAGCTAPSPANDDGLNQLQRQAQFNIRSVGIQGADASVLSTGDAATINDIAEERSSYSEKHFRIKHILEEAGAL
jgi:hypothetical protein